MVCFCGTDKSPSNRKDKSGLSFLEWGSHSRLTRRPVHLAQCGSPFGLTLFWGGGVVASSGFLPPGLYQVSPDSPW